jgi:hypothetical protein
MGSRPSDTLPTKLGQLWTAPNPPTNVCLEEAPAEHVVVHARPAGRLGVDVSESAGLHFCSSSSGGMRRTLGCVDSPRADRTAVKSGSRLCSSRWDVGRRPCAGCPPAFGHWRPTRAGSHAREPGVAAASQTATADEMAPPATPSGNPGTGDYPDGRARLSGTPGRSAPLAQLTSPSTRDHPPALGAVLPGRSCPIPPRTAATR